MMTARARTNSNEARSIPAKTRGTTPALEPLPLAFAYGIGSSTLFSRASLPVRVQTQTGSALAETASQIALASANCECQPDHNADPAAGRLARLGLGQVQLPGQGSAAAPET